MSFGIFGSSVADADAAAATLANAISLVSAVSDPASAKRVLDRLKDGLEEAKQRQAEAQRQEAANAERLKGLIASEQAQQKQQAKLDGISNDLAQHQSRLDVASSALAEREKALERREAAVGEAEAKHAKAAQALATRVESYKRALG